LQALRSADHLTIRGSISELIDRGDRGAQISMQADAFRTSDGTPVYRATYVTLARADGGFSHEPTPPKTRRPAVERPPPDWTCTCATRPDQALLYALNGDPNPIHTDPQAARSAGFARPILHGLCTYGIACRAVLASVYAFDSRALRRFDARFSAPVVPGDTLVVDMWGDAADLHFEVKAAERDVIVLRDGRCGLQAED
jgi:acyl dehydratase